MTTPAKAALDAWRSAERRWERLETTEPGRTAAGLQVAIHWLRYQSAVGAYGPHEVVVIADGARTCVASSVAAADLFGRSCLGLTLDELTPFAHPDIVGLWQLLERHGRLRGRFEVVDAGGRISVVGVRAVAHLPLSGYFAWLLGPSTHAAPPPAARRARTVLALSPTAAWSGRAVPVQIVEADGELVAGLLPRQRATPARSG